jgi:nucleotide-binding universal stress UspA family protein
MQLPPQIDAEREQATLEKIEAQTRRFDAEGSWGVDLQSGRPAEVIARFVSEHRADLLIVGAHKHGLWGRVLGEETAMEIARIIDVPMLVAAHGMSRLPRRVMVAMDIKPYGLEGMPDALALTTEKPSITCTHVKPRAEFLGIDWAEFDREYEMAMHERFGAIEKTLVTQGMRSDLIVLNGDVTRELADFAAYSKAELVVVGINRRRGRIRATGGRLATRMLRTIQGSVLIVPAVTPSYVLEGTSHRGVTDVLQDPRQWSRAMKSFTARNAGRVCSLEVDDPEIGALVEAKSYPLIGTDYDHRDRRLTIIVGDIHGTSRHLARSVPNPESISILSFDGRDTALSVVHGAGQTLLTF